MEPMRKPTEMSEESPESFVGRAASAWLIATNTNSSLTLPPLINSPFYGFRLEVRP